MALKYIDRKKGSAFLYVILAVFVMILMAGITVSLLVYEIRLNRITEERMEAKYLAEAGVEHAMLGTGSSGSEIVRDEDGNILYEYSYSVSGGYINITSYGYAESRRKIKIECSVRDDLIEKWKETPLN